MVAYVFLAERISTIVSGALAATMPHAQSATIRLQKKMIRADAQNVGQQVDGIRMDQRAGASANILSTSEKVENAKDVKISSKDVESVNKQIMYMETNQRFISAMTQM